MTIGLTIRRACLPPLLLTLSLGAGCGKDEGKAPATQVAAKVDAAEITVHQVNAVLARTPDVKPETAPKVKQQVLDRLIDQQLAVQQALRRKLDRSPSVVQALEAARAEVLARAFADEIARQQPKPTADETKQYYAAHPELFAQRRVFALEEISIAEDGALEGLAEVVAKARSTAEITAWLRAKNAKYAENRGVRAAEQIPLELLPRLQTMKEGEMRLLEGGNGTLQVLRVVTMKSAPVDEATATPRIEQFLFNRRVSEALQKEMKQVKDAAKIEYRGEFAEASKAPQGESKK